MRSTLSLSPQALYLSQRLAKCRSDFLLAFLFPALSSFFLAYHLEMSVLFKLKVDNHQVCGHS